MCLTLILHQRCEPNLAAAAAASAGKGHLFLDTFFSPFFVRSSALQATNEITSTSTAAITQFILIYRSEVKMQGHCFIIRRSQLLTTQLFAAATF